MTHEVKFPAFMFHATLAPEGRKFASLQEFQLAEHADDGWIDMQIRKPLPAGLTLTEPPKHTYRSDTGQTYPHTPDRKKGA